MCLAKKTYAAEAPVGVVGSAPDGSEVDVLPLRMADFILPNILVRLFLRSAGGVCCSIVYDGAQV